MQLPLFKPLKLPLQVCALEGEHIVRWGQEAVGAVASACCGQPFQVWDFVCGRALSRGSQCGGSRRRLTSSEICCSLHFPLLIAMPQLVPSSQGCSAGAAVLHRPDTSLTQRSCLSVDVLCCCSATPPHCHAAAGSVATRPPNRRCCSGSSSTPASLCASPRCCTVFACCSLLCFSWFRHHKAAQQALLFWILLATGLAIGDATIMPPFTGTLLTDTQTQRCKSYSCVTRW